MTRIWIINLQQIQNLDSSRIEKPVESNPSIYFLELIVVGLIDGFFEPKLYTSYSGFFSVLSSASIKEHRTTI